MIVKQVNGEFINKPEIGSRCILRGIGTVTALNDSLCFGTVEKPRAKMIQIGDSWNYLLSDYFDD